MKVKSSMKSITANFSKVFRCEYCDLQNIFNGENPRFYNCGVYGWNCDIYTGFSSAHGCNYAITTGYRNMRGERIPAELIKKYDAIARDILNNYSWIDKEPDGTSTRTAKLEENRNNFINELMNI